MYLCLGLLATGFVLQGTAYIHIFLHFSQGCLFNIHLRHINLVSIISIRPTSPLHGTSFEMFLSSKFVLTQKFFWPHLFSRVSFHSPQALLSPHLFPEHLIQFRGLEIWPPSPVLSSELQIHTVGCLKGSWSFRVLNRTLWPILFITMWLNSITCITIRSASTRHLEAPTQPSPSHTHCTLQLYF